MHGAEILCVVDADVIRGDAKAERRHRRRRHWLNVRLNVLLGIARCLRRCVIGILIWLIART